MLDNFYFEDKYLTVPEKIYDISQLGVKLTEIKPILKRLLEEYGETPKFIGEIRKLLIDCIREDDLPKALAVIRWVVSSTDKFFGDDLAIINDKDGMEPIVDIAYDMGNRDFGLDLGGFCKDLGYVNDEDNY